IQTRAPASIGINNRYPSGSCSTQPKGSGRDDSNEFIKQGFCSAEVGRIETLAEPPINRPKQISGFGWPPLITPQPRQTHCGAEFKRLGALTLGCGKSRPEKAFRLITCLKPKLAFDAINLGIPHMLVVA